LKLGKKHKESETNCYINVFKWNVPHVKVIMAGLLNKVFLFMVQCFAHNSLPLRLIRN